jgi:hypothetical protein
MMLWQVMVIMIMLCRVLGMVVEKIEKMEIE